MIQKEMRSEKDPLQNLKFYSGDVRDEDPFDSLYSDAKAYVTLNALLFDGIETEKARVKEGRKLNPSFVRRYEDTLSIIHGIISCMKPLEQETVVYRVERLTDYRKFIQAGRMTSFVSCSDMEFLDSYTDKADLVFMEVHVKPGVLCAHLEDELEDYLKQDEHELLISPYCPIRVKQTCVPEQYSAVRDRNGNPVCIYTFVDVYPAFLHETYAPVCFDQKLIDRCCKAIDLLNSQEEVDEQNLQAYLSFKKMIHNTVKNDMTVM